MASNTKAYLAVVFICIVWGTTYLAIRIGVMHYPAFLFAGVRQSVAGVILMLFAHYFSRKKDLSRANILRNMLIGFLMLTLGNGCVTWGEKFIPSGISALICSMMPMFAISFNLLGSRRDHFNGMIGMGLLFGISGVGLIFRHDIAELSKPGYLMGIGATLFATSSWALGSVINRKKAIGVNPFYDSGMQLLFGGIFMLIISTVADDYTGFTLWNTDGVMSLIYLIIFGSALAYAAYMYALNHLPVGIATIYAYVNPLIAVLAGFLFLNEVLNVYTALAFVSIVISVFLMNYGYRKQHKESVSMAEAFPEGAPAES